MVNGLGPIYCFSNAIATQQPKALSAKHGTWLLWVMG